METARCMVGIKKAQINRQEAQTPESETIVHDGRTVRFLHGPQGLRKF